MIDALLLLAVLVAFLLLLLAVSRPAVGRDDNLGLFAFREAPPDEPPTQPPAGGKGREEFKRA